MSLNVSVAGFPDKRLVSSRLDLCHQLSRSRLGTSTSRAHPCIGELIVNTHWPRPNSVHSKTVLAYIINNLIKRKVGLLCIVSRWPYLAT